MAIRGTALVLIGLMLGGCMQATIDPASEANLTPRDRRLLANAPYARVAPPPQFQRSIVEYHRKEAPGSIVIDTDAHRTKGFAVARYGIATARRAWLSAADVANTRPLVDVEKLRPRHR